VLTLLPERFAPITSMIGFPELPLEEAGKRLLARRQQLHGSYASGLGIHTVDETYYTLQGIVIQNPVKPRRNGKVMSLAEPAPRTFPTTPSSPLTPRFLC
jgi:hypothetical protein